MAPEPVPPVGRRVVVTGLAGSGKSTFAHALAAATDAPVVHLDLLFWQPGWTVPTESQWQASQREALAGDDWIADGNCSDTLDLRLTLADTVVVVATPWWRCVGRAVARGFKMPPELPAGCEFSRWTRLRDELGVARRTFGKRHREPALEASIIERHADRLHVHTLRSVADADELLARVRSTGG